MTTATSGELAAAILAAQQATAAEVQAINDLTQTSQDLVQRFIDSGDTWDAAAAITTNIDTTSDNDKPVSTAQQTALDLKSNKADIFTINNQNIFSEGSGGGNLDIVIT
jgi:hypothetical protein